MATIRPFAALRPKPELAARICELPYDVMSSEEARALAKDNPLSFLHVSKPEIDLEPSVDVYSAAVYQKGRKNFQRLIGQGSLGQDPQPCFYLYRQVMGAHSQTGLVAVASCQEYLEGKIKKHEFTRPDKEDDRVRHIETLDAQTGPVFLVYRENATISRLIAAKTTEKPDVDFTAADGVRHTSWSIMEPREMDLISREFQSMPAVYIADGHHRSAAAARVYQTRKGAGNSGWFLSVIFPHSQMQILPYNRVLKDLNGNSAAQVLEKLSANFTISEKGTAKPVRKHQVCLYLQKRWLTLEFHPKLTTNLEPVRALDVALLQEHVLALLFGIDDPRTSKRINFVGGIRGTAELEQLVNSGEYACAFSLFPTSIEDLMSIADRNGIMPPKSTWFEPKLRDAMFCHLL